MEKSQFWIFMLITWHGQSFFEIEVKRGSGGEKQRVVLAIDPYDESLGLRIPKVEAQILLITHCHRDHDNIKAVQGEPFLITEPGEYELKGVLIKGISSFHDTKEGRELGSNTIYKFEAEGIKLCHLGNLGQKELTPEQLEEIGEVDILMISVAGPAEFINGKQASELVAQIEPKIVIPMHYKIPKLKLAIEGVEKFLKVMGVEKIEPQNKLKITSRDLGKEETDIVILEP